MVGFITQSRVIVSLTSLIGFDYPRCSCLERDLARQLIVRALDGLGEGDRFRTILPSLDVDMDTLNNYVHGFVFNSFYFYRR